MNIQRGLALACVILGVLVLAFGRPALLGNDTTPTAVSVPAADGLQADPGLPPQITPEPWRSNLPVPEIVTTTKEDKDVPEAAVAPRCVNPVRWSEIPDNVVGMLSFPSLGHATWVVTGTVMSTPRHDAMIDITTGIFGSGTTTVFRGHVARYRNAAAIPAPFGKIARLAVGDQFEYWQRDQDCPTVLQVIASTQIPGGGQQYAELNTPVSGVDARLVTCDGTAIIVNGIIDHYTHTRVVDAVIVH